jgi:hypothetical protein
MAQITQQQWDTIVFDAFGLRSGSNPDDLDGATYSMDMDINDPRSGVPANWSSLLDGTIAQIMQFPGYQDRYLMIVQPSTGGSWEYPNCFPKCSSYASSVLTAVQMGQATGEDLANWVVANIPSEARDRGDGATEATNEQAPRSAPTSAALD